MPQFQFANDVVVWAQLFWLSVFFAILYFGVVRMTLPKLGRTIDAREGKIAGDLSSAERAKAEGDNLAATYQAGIDAAHKAARAASADAKAKASASVEKALAAGNAVLAERAAQAEAALDAARARALVEIEQVSAGAAADIVERLTGHRPDPVLVTDATKTVISA